MEEKQLRLTDKRQIADGVVSLEFETPDGGPLPDWDAGSHIDLVMSGGIVRQYSLCGGSESTWRVAVLHEPAGRGGSAFVHTQLEVGSTVGVRGPRNNFSLVPSERYLFIAGGIGITPILPMVEAAVAEGADWQLLYGGRSRSSMAFTEELERFGGRVEIAPEDESGLLDLDRALAGAGEGLHVYCCGPKGLLEAVEARCASLPQVDLHVERFTAEPVPELAGDGTFEVELVQSGVTLEVPNDKTILEVCEEAGIPVMSSCREGLCGTCETFVCSGRPDHFDSILTPEEREEGDRMMICVSRCLGDRLELDL